MSCRPLPPFSNPVSSTVTARRRCAFFCLTSSTRRRNSSTVGLRLQFRRDRCSPGRPIDPNEQTKVSHSPDILEPPREALGLSSLIRKHCITTSYINCQPSRTTEDSLRIRESMSVFPIVVDSRPSYLGDSTTALSLGLMPIGASTLVEYVGSKVSAITHRNIRVVTDFQPCERLLGGPCVWRARPRSGRCASRSLARACVTTSHRTGCSSLTPDTCRRGDSTPLPSCAICSMDRLAQPISSRSKRMPPARGTGSSSTGAASSDGFSVTTTKSRWSVTSGVVCSLVPVSSALKAISVPLTSLVELRTALAAQGVPSRDVPIRGGVYDLSRPGGMLGLSEQMLGAGHRARRRS